MESRESGKSPIWDALSPLIVPGVTLLLVAVAAVLGLSLSPSDPKTASIILFVASVIIVGVTVYTWRSREPSPLDQKLLRYRYKPWVRWCCAIASLAFLGLTGWAIRGLVVSPIPQHTVTFINRSSKDVTVNTLGEFNILPALPSAVMPIAKGYLRYHMNGNSTIDDTFVVPAHTEVTAYIEVLEPQRFRGYFESGTTIMVVWAYGQPFTSEDSEIPFDAYSFDKYALKIVVADADGTPTATPSY